MIIERYKAKNCDICGKTLALKRGLFYQEQCTYITIRKDSCYKVNDVHLCSECWNELRIKTQIALGKREEK